MLRYLYVSFSFFFLFWPQAFTGGPENYIFIKFELFEFLNLSLDHVLLKLSIHSSASPRLKLIIRGSAAPRRVTGSLRLHNTLLISDLWLEQSLKWEKKVSVWLKSNGPGTFKISGLLSIPRENFPFPRSLLRPAKTSLRSVFDNWPPLRPRKMKVRLSECKVRLRIFLFLDHYFPAIQNYYSITNKTEKPFKKAVQNMISQGRL